MDLNTNPKKTQSTGTLIVKVSTARGAIPLEGAAVSIRGSTPDTSGIIYSLSSDRDGLTDRVTLPAPARVLSSSPGNSAPYSLWNVDVFKEGYIPVSFQNVPVFASVVSVQPAIMIPESEGFRKTQIYNESEAPQL